METVFAHIYSDGEIRSIFGKWFGRLDEPTALTRAMFIFGSLRE